MVKINEYRIERNSQDYFISTDNDAQPVLTVPLDLGKSGYPLHSPGCADCMIVDGCRAVGHPVAGVDYPSTFQALDEWFRGEVACRAYIRRLRWPTGFCCPDCGVPSVEPWEMAGGWLRCRACRRETSITAGTIIRRDPQAAADMVPGDVVRDQPEERGERPGAAACPRPRQLRDLMDLAAQAAAGHGAARPRPPCRRDRGRRNLCGRPGRRQAGP